VESLGKSDSIKFISQFSELKCFKILIFEWILCAGKKKKQIAEIGLGRKNQLRPSMSSHC
jgi:hypothetical protein